MQALQLPAHPARPLQPERLRGGGGPLGLQRIPEQRRMGQEPGPERRRALLIVAIPRLQIAGRQRLFTQPVHQGLGRCGVGARQRYQHPAGRPRRDDSRAHRLEHRLGQAAQEPQTAIHPTGIPPQPRRQLPLRAPVRQRFLQQPRLLNRLQDPTLMAGDHPRQRLRQRTVPTLHRDRVRAQPIQRLPAPITIHQHPGTRFPNRHHRGALTVLLHRHQQRPHRRRSRQPLRGKRRTDLVPLQRFDPRGGPRVHDYTVAPAPPKRSRVLVCKHHPGCHKRSDNEEVGMRHTSTFASTRPRLQRVSPCAQSR